jgi:hypothetical protein
LPKSRPSTDPSPQERSCKRVLSIHGHDADAPRFRLGDSSPSKTPHWWLRSISSGSRPRPRQPPGRPTANATRTPGRACPSSTAGAGQVNHPAPV